MTSAIKEPIHFSPGTGKSAVAMASIREFCRPKGTWKEFWPRHLMNVSPNNRLPRGFSKKLADLQFPDFDAQPDRPVTRPASWMAQNMSSISEAVQKLEPAAPAKKPARKKPKAAAKPAE